MATNSAIQTKYMGGMDQSTTRDHAVWFDQHRNATYTDRHGEHPFENGRCWWSVIEKRSGMPTGTIHPLEWEAPFDVPQVYLLDAIGKIAKVGTRGASLLPASVKTDRVRINYERMYQEDNEAALDHWRLCVANATRYNLPIPEYGDPIEPRLLELAGPEPRSPRIAQALMAGDPWILGQVSPTFDEATQSWKVEENERLAKLIRRTVRHRIMPGDVERAPALVSVPVEHPQAPDDVLELKAQMVALQKQLAEMAGNAKPKKSHHKKVPSVQTGV